MKKYRELLLTLLVIAAWLVLMKVTVGDRGQTVPSGGTRAKVRQSVPQPALPSRSLLVRAVAV
jgi:hypothetical protein